MTDITIVLNKFSGHQSEHAEALKKGLKQVGHHGRIAIHGQRINTKLTACWGWRLGARLRSEGHEVLVMERGYIGDRFSYTSLGWNGLNGYASFPEYEQTDDKRLQDMKVELLPWKNEGEYSLILGQVPSDASLRGIDLCPLYRKWASELRQANGLPVFFRPHPDVLRRGIRQDVEGAPTLGGSLQEAFSKAITCMAFNSNSTVDSVLNGIPTIATDEGAMAWDMCGHHAGETKKPDREAWLRKLSYTQWAMSEIESGFPLVKLMEGK